MDRIDLPVEAVSINGQYIEDAIDGYMTVKTSGRESLEPEIENFDSTTADGEKIKNIRYSSRTIKVNFFLQAKNLEELRKKLNHLQNLLSMEEADFVFNDESDKYFTGKPYITSDIKDYKNALAGTYEIYCAYPFKRSVNLYEVSIPTSAEGASSEFLINYNGNEPARPVLTAEFPVGTGEDYSQDGDCGFVAFIDDDENIIQLGNPDAIDLDEFNKADSLINASLSSIAGWNTSGGNNFKNMPITGNMTTGNITDTYWGKGKGQTMAFAKPALSANGTSWHGSTLYKDTTGAINFDISAVHRMCANAATELGYFEIGAYTIETSPKLVAGIAIDKETSGTTATVRYIVGGKQVGTASIDLSYYNTNFGYCKRTAVYTTKYYYKTVKVKKKKKKVKYSRQVLKGYNYTQSNLNILISKSGNTIYFTVGNVAKKSFPAGDAENFAAKRVICNYGRYRNNAALHTNATASIRFTQNPSGAFADIPNVFTSGDIVEADCNDASVTIRRIGTDEGISAPEYGARGNNWEEFVIKPGTNAITAIWSDWVDENYKPKITIAYNEVYK